MMARFVLSSILIILYSTQEGLSQNYSLEIRPSVVSIDSSTYQGYSTLFYQDLSDVKKAWWRYVKSRSIIFNKVTHYELKIPASDKNEEPIWLISKISGEEGEPSDLQLAIKSKISGDKANQELKDMLLDFKLSFYTGPIQKKIDEQEKASIRLSRQLNKYEQREKIPRGLSEDEIDELVKVYTLKLQKVNQQLDSLKNTLKRIK